MTGRRRRGWRRVRETERVGSKCGGFVSLHFTLFLFASVLFLAGSVAMMLPVTPGLSERLSEDTKRTLNFASALVFTVGSVAFVVLPMLGKLVRDYEEAVEL